MLIFYLFIISFYFLKEIIESFNIDELVKSPNSVTPAKAGVTEAIEMIGFQLSLE